MITNDAVSLLQERFPEIAFELSLSRLKEKKLPQDVLYVEGIQKAELFFHYQSWLEEVPTRRLVFVEKDLHKIASFIKLPYAATLLGHPQVLLIKELTESCVGKLPYFSVDAIASASFREEVKRKSLLAYYRKLDRIQSDMLFYNFLRNVRHLADAFDPNRMKNAFSGTPAIVCGAGPSLKPEMLKKYQDKALIIAGGSAIAALSARDAYMHFCMAVDPNLGELKILNGRIPKDAALLFSTRLQPDVPDGHSGAKGYIRTDSNGCQQMWLDAELGLTGPALGFDLSSEAMSVTSICVAFARHLGCNPILLEGIDMAYTFQKQYADGVVSSKENEGIIHCKRKGRNQETVHTALHFIMESRAISEYAKQYPQTRFIDTTDRGLGFEGIEQMSLDEALKECKQPPDLKEKVRQEIQKCLMSDITKDKIEERIQKLKQSLHHVAGHLEVLAGEKPGSKALAEVEMKEELAYKVLFYDMPELFMNDGQDPYKQFFNLVKKYLLAISI